MTNAHSAIHIATALVDDGYTPFVPQTSILWEAITPKPWEWWIKYDLRVVGQCKLLLRIPGESKGADIECSHAKDLGIPIVFLSSTDPQEAVNAAREANGFIACNPGKMFIASSRLKRVGVEHSYELERVIFMK
jgi:hypothetical protein